MQRDAAGAAPYLLGSHGRLADRRDRAPPAACASRRSSLRRRCCSLRGAITSLTLEASTGGGARRSTPTVHAPPPRPPARPLPPRVRPPVSRADLRLADRRRAAVPRVVSAVRVRQGERRVGEGGHARAAQPADRASALRPRRPSAAATRGSFRWPRSERRPGSSSRRRRSKTEGSRRIGCGSRFRNRPAAGS